MSRKSLRDRIRSVFPAGLAASPAVGVTAAPAATPRFTG